MRTPARFFVVTVALVATVAAGAPAAEGAKRAKTPRLKAFASCAGLIGYARRHVPPPRPFVPPALPRRDVPTFGGGNDGGSGPMPIAAPAPAPESDKVGDDSSSTNIQEAGVDEPDIVKSDGTNVFALTEGRLTAVDARSPTPRRLSSVTIRGSGAEMLEQGRRILVISASGDGTLLTEVDIANPAKMRVLRELSVDGTHVSSRLHGHTVRIVVTSTPRAIELPAPRPVADGPTVIADTAKRKPLRARRAGWVPSSLLRNRRSGHKRRRALVACDDVRRTPRFTGAGMLSVLTFDLSYGIHDHDSDAVMTDASTVYASQGSVYVATAGGWERGDTSIHRFDVNGDKRTDYRASGEVPGDLLNQFSLSEHKGMLRAATTSNANESQSYVTVLATKGGRLEKAGQVGGLGRGERIYAVRFIGDRGYVVTFRQTDPLYTLDLADPARPRVTGELKILGYSAYLHPVGEHELVGVGQDATPEGIRLGTQVSLFDVSNAAEPRLLQRAGLGESTSSDAEFDHHAFLWWAPKRLAVVPVSDASGSAAQAIAFRVNRDGIGVAGKTVERADVLRTLVVGGRLFTLTGEGLHAYDLDTLAPGPFTAFESG